jgi:hypothetical protein
MELNQSDLVVGKTYTNGKKRETIRKVLGFPSCPGNWETKICVRYLVLKGLRPEVGTEFTITRRSFAKWASREVML